MKSLKSFFFLLAAAAALGGSISCGGSTTPEPPGDLTFSGTITSGGSPLAGVTVFLSGGESKSAVTDAGGAFSFAGLTGSSFVVTPSLRNTVFTPSNYELGAQSRTNLAFTAAAATYGLDRRQDRRGLHRTQPERASGFRRQRRPRPPLVLPDVQSTYLWPG